MKTFKVKLVKGMTATQERHRECVRGLGLRKIGQERVVLDTPANRGMATRVAYLVKVEG